MPVVASYLYRHGHRLRAVAVDEHVDCPANRSQFVWIGLCDPCMEKIATLQRLYGLHPLAVEDALKDGQLPKVDVYGDQLFVIARAAHLEDGRSISASRRCSSGTAISSRCGRGLHAHARAAARASRGRAHLARARCRPCPSCRARLHVDAYLPIVTAIEDGVLTMEQRILDAFLDRQGIARISALRRDLIRVQRILVPMEEVARKPKWLLPSCFVQSAPGSRRCAPPDPTSLPGGRCVALTSVASISVPFLSIRPRWSS